MSLALAIEWKLKKLGEWQNQVSIRAHNDQLTHWQVNGFSQPDQATLDLWVSEFNSQGKYEYEFDINQFLIELESALGEDSADDLADQIRRFERYGSRREFGKIKRLGERLVQKNKMTQAQFNGMKSLFLSKGINLDNY